MTVEIADVADVLAKMSDGEFVTVYLVKGGPIQGDDELAMFPKNGVPLAADITQTVLGGFLKASPVPVAQNQTTGEMEPQYTSLGWVAKWVRDAVDAVALRGLRTNAAEVVVDPTPE